MTRTTAVGETMSGDGFYDFQRFKRKENKCIKDRELKSMWKFLVGEDVYR